MAETYELLAARVPQSKKAALKAFAARRGTTIQALLNDAIDDIVGTGRTAPPSLGRVIARLRPLAPELRSRGVRRLCVFGSVARGEARPGSDVDLFAEFDPQARVSIVRIGSIKAALEAALGCAVDFGDRRSLTPEAAAAAERDAVEVFG